MLDFIEPSKIEVSNISTQKDLTSLPETGMVFTNLLLENKPLALHLEGTLASDAIQASQFGPHTISMNFEDPAEETAFSKLTEFFDNVDIIDSNWKINDMLKGDKLYIKLKMKDNKYLTRTNIKLNPKNYATAPLHKYAGVEVFAELKAYFNMEKKEAGFYFEISKLVFAS
jgi:hypothetical protein